MSEHRGEVTELLLDWGDGDRDAVDKLVPLVYGELRRLAGGMLRGERSNHTLQPTALANEAYLRLVDQSRVHWQNRAHFFAIAGKMMRRILVDHARRQSALRRGGDAARVSFSEALEISDAGEVDVVALDEALAELEAMDERQARIVELRFFSGLTVEETAAALGISPITVKRDWRTAKLWLYRRLSGGDG